MSRRRYHDIVLKNVYIAERINLAEWGIYFHYMHMYIVPEPVTLRNVDNIVGFLPAN